MNDNDFSWPSKCGGEHSWPKGIFHIKEKKDDTLNTSLTTLNLNNELVYENGYATHFMPLSLMNNKKSSQAMKTLSTVSLEVTVLLVCVLYYY